MKKSSFQTISINFGKQNRMVNSVESFFSDPSTGHKQGDCFQKLWLFFLEVELMACRLIIFYGNQTDIRKVYYLIQDGQLTGCK